MRSAAGKSFVLLACLGLSAPCAAACAPLGLSPGEVQALKARAFAVAPGQLEPMLLGLADCLADPDPALRDGVGYEGLAILLRRGDVPPPILQALSQALLEALALPDPVGVHRPFAALALSEVARADRLAPGLSPAGRAQLLEAGARFLESVSDYRGFNNAEGWRHGVAHGADLMLQLSRNPAVGREGLLRIQSAIGSQVAPEVHSYVFGENERLARATFALASRGVLTEADWKAWFGRIGNPAPLAGWGDAFLSETGLARRHNLRTFALALHAAAAETGNANIAALKSGAQGLLAATQ